jgi:hypothetical protein
MPARRWLETDTERGSRLHRSQPTDGLGVDSGALVAPLVFVPE